MDRRRRLRGRGGLAADRGPKARTLMAEAPRIEDLRAEARHHRMRLDLYKAKMYGLRPTTMARLRELERTDEAAGARLRAAEREHATHTPVAEPAHPLGPD